MVEEGLEDGGRVGKVRTKDHLWTETEWSSEKCREDFRTRPSVPVTPGSVWVYTEWTHTGRAAHTPGGGRDGRRPTATDTTRGLSLDLVFTVFPESVYGPVAGVP